MAETGSRAVPRHVLTENIESIAVVSAVVGVAMALAGLAWVTGAAVAWLVAVAAALGVGWVARADGRARLLMASLPCTLLTGSAVVPFEGRYIPAAFILGALLVASRTEAKGALAWLRQRPGLVGVIVVYILWAAIVTTTSIARGTSALYVAGFCLTFACALLAAGPMLTDGRVVRGVVAAMAGLGVAQVLVGWILAVVGPVILYGHALGLYFIEEFVLFGRSTGIVTYQAYGPFVGPSTVPLAFGIASALFLGATAGRWMRVVWALCALAMAAALLASMSREGIMMAAIVAAVVAAVGLKAHRVQVVPVVATLGLGLVFVASIGGAITVTGRLDLVAQRYGSQGVAILMNPDLAERGMTAGDVLVDPGTSPGGPSAQPAGSSAQARASAKPSYPAVVDLKTSSSLIARVSLWQAAVDAARRSPIVGYGLGTNADAIKPFLSRSDPYLVGATTHSTIFRTLVETGVPGLIILVVFMIMGASFALRWALRRPGQLDPGRAVLVGCLLALAAHQVVGTMLLGGFEYADWVLALAVVGLSADLVPTSRPGGPRETASSSSIDGRR